MAFGGAVKLTGESEYRQALQNITQSLKMVNSEMKLVSSAFDKNDKSTSAVAAKSEVLNQKLSQQQEKVKVLADRYKAMVEQYGKNSTAQEKLTQQITKEKAKLDEIGTSLGKASKEYQDQEKVVKDLENKQNSYNKAVDDAKIKLNGAQAEVNKTSKELKDLGTNTQEAGDAAKEASNEGFTVFKGILANLASQAITAALNGLKKLGSAVIDVGKQAISAYADYEQLVGGVETLFKDSAKEVQNYANMAYKTAGLSANEYMETVTSFSASLLQGLGGDTAKAAEIADMAIIDMSDNANKMGTSMEMIQNAYQGFAKQNYTMLDNLKLGYGGTQEEMARLINESGVLGDSMKVTAKNVKDVPFDKMIEAIHQVQVNMGITGTTAKEASSTIQGSVNSMKAAWGNLLVAIADDNQDLSKSVNQFVDSAITAGKNLLPRIKIVVDGAKKLISSIVTEVFPKIKKEIPQLAPLIDTFQWFIDNRGLVVGAIGAMIAAFAANKVASFTKVISDTTKHLIDIAKGSAAATVATTANTTATAANSAVQTTAATTTGILTGAVNLLNAAWKSNPIGLVIAGLTAAISIFSLFKGKTDEATESQKQLSKEIQEQSEEIDRNRSAWDDLVQSQQNSINTGMTEISHYQSLYDELQNIVDANGKVKEGYEARASFITSTLSEALGIEIKNVDGVIQNYGELKNTIDDVMEKKKAQIILDSQESLYKEAINKQTEAVKELQLAEEGLKQKKEERKAAEEQYATASQKLNEALAMGSEALVNQYIDEMATAERKMQTIDNDTVNLQENYDKQQGLLEEYSYNIGQYENNMALAHAGKYDEMTNVNWEYVKDYQKAGDAEKAALEDQVKTTEYQLNILKQLKDKSGSDLYDSQIAAAEKQLSNLKENLNKYNSATDSGLNETTVIWNDNLDDQLSEITGRKFEFKNDGSGNVQAYIDGIASGEPQSEAKMAQLVTNTIYEISKQKTGAKTAGEDLIDGVNNGVANQRKQSGVFSTIANFGASLLNKLRNSLQEHSPSKATNEMGQYLLQGLGLGIESEEKAVLKQVSSFGEDIVDTLNNSLSAGVDFGAISNIKTKIPGRYVTRNGVNSPESTTDNFSSMVIAFKTALSEMTVEMDDETMGKFVEKTVARAIYT